MRSLLPGVCLYALLLTGCVDTSQGTILGAMTYFRVEGGPSILVNQGWVRLFAEGDTSTPVAELETDSLGRFNFEVEEGNWLVSGSLEQAGPYTGTVGPFGVAGHATTRLFLGIDESAPNAPIVGEVSPTGEIGVTGGSVTFSVTAMTTIESGEATGWRWDFGDGAEPQLSSEKNPTVTLKEPGTYTASVIVYNPGGTSRPKSFEYTVAAVSE